MEQLPRYRMLSETGFIAGVPRRRFDQFNFEGWPKGARLEPLNAAAKKIASYYEKNRTEAFLPKTPFNKELGQFYLPAYLRPAVAGYSPGSEYGAHLPTPIDIDDARPGMPRYRAKHRQLLGARRVEASENRIG
jgi:hypothetical protein